MKCKLHRAVIFVAFLGVLISSCEKNDSQAVQTPTVTLVKDLPADTIIGMTTMGQPYGSGKYTLFSLERNEVVLNADSATSRWDIGFRGTTIIINSGVSGPGKGGAFVFTGTFEELKAVPVDSVFRVDIAASNLAIPSGSNRGWYIYNPPVNLITPIPGRMLVIRTAAAQKMVKLEILNYYKGGVTPAATASDDEKLKKQRYFTFRYLLQPDGTVNFPL